MKKLLFVLSVFLVMNTGCEVLDAVVSGTTTNAPLTKDEVIRGLKEALTVATDTSVNLAHKLDGFNGNQAIRILLPDEVKKAENLIKQYVPGGDALLEKLVVRLNRAAEDAAVEARPIMVNAVTSITFSDAFGILQGSDTAATQYLRVKTFDQLQGVFKPRIQNSLEKVGAQQLWEEITDKYNTAVNAIPLGLGPDPINTDLAAYTTEKALNGMFYYVAEEERQIRKDPLDRVTALLKRVFGSLDS